MLCMRDSRAQKRSSACPILSRGESGGAAFLLPSLGLPPPVKAPRDERKFAKREGGACKCKYAGERGEKKKEHREKRERESSTMSEDHRFSGLSIFLHRQYSRANCPKLRRNKVFPPFFSLPLTAGDFKSPSYSGYRCACARVFRIEPFRSLARTRERTIIPRIRFLH